MVKAHSAHFFILNAPHTVPQAPAGCKGIVCIGASGHQSLDPATRFQVHSRSQYTGIPQIRAHGIHNCRHHSLARTRIHRPTKKAVFTTTTTTPGVVDRRRFRESRYIRSSLLLLHRYITSLIMGSSTDDVFNALGVLGGVILALSLLPQIYLAHKRRSAKDISYIWQVSRVQVML